MLGIIRDQELSAVVVLGHLRVRSLELACEVAESLHMAVVLRGSPVMIASQKTSVLLRDDFRLELTVRKGEAPTTWLSDYSKFDVRAWCARFNYLAMYEPWDCVKPPVAPLAPGEDPPILKPERYAHMVPLRLVGHQTAPYLTAWQVLRGIGAVHGAPPIDPYSVIESVCDRNGIKPRTVRAT